MLSQGATIDKSLPKGAPRAPKIESLESIRAPRGTISGHFGRTVAATVGKSLHGPSKWDEKGSRTFNTATATCRVNPWNRPGGGQQEGEEDKQRYHTPADPKWSAYWALLASC